MLGDLLVRVLLGSEPAPDHLDAALIYKGREITDQGYSRQVLMRGEWQIDGAIASKNVAFGPFVGPVIFDTVRLINADTVLDDMPFDVDVRVARGMIYIHAVKVVVGG